MDLWHGAWNLVWSPAPMGAYPTGWTLTESAHMDGDGRDDLLWRHAYLGYFVILAEDLAAAHPRP